LDKFLADAPRFEKLVLSVEWLKLFIQEHPNLPFRLSYVDDAFFSDGSLKLFSADMRAVGRDDLIPVIQRTKDRLALLSVAALNSDWLIFPDGRMLLWSYYSYSGAPDRLKNRAADATLLKWPVSDLPTKPCSDDSRFRGCVGREISADGTLQPMN
jgi:hypothetical protein